MNTITFEELEKLDPSQITVVDVRKEADFVRGSFPGAINIPAEEAREDLSLIPDDKPVYLMCHTGERSSELVEDLEEAGRKNA